VEYVSGTDIDEAKSKAATADAAIVFVNQPMSEGRDGTLSLPDNQDALVEAVADANKNTVVVLETGGPILMPWAEKSAAIMAAWFPGISGGQAIAEVLTGRVNPSGKLSVTFPRSIDDLPHHDIFGIDLLQAQQQQPRPASGAATPGGGMGRQSLPPFDANYNEGLLVGYKWYDARNKQPLFAFGHGLSYATYSYANANVIQDKGIQVSFVVKNTGKRTGTEISQVYLAMPESTGEPPKRLVGWSRVDLAPGEEKNVTVSVDPHYCAVFNAEKHKWELVAGDYQILIGGSSDALPLKKTLRLDNASLPPLAAE
jgi:beta-glucosidase